MIINANAKNGIFLATPQEINLEFEKDFTNKINLRWLIRLIQNDALLSFYGSTAWKKVREDVKQRDHYECQRCAYYKRLTTSLKPRDLHVHHICELEKFPHLALNLNNLITVCHNCHNIIHDRFQEVIIVPETTNYDSKEWFI